MRCYTNRENTQNKLEFANVLIKVHLPNQTCKSRKETQKIYSLEFLWEIFVNTIFHFLSFDPKTLIIFPSRDILLKITFFHYFGMSHFSKEVNFLQSSKSNILYILKNTYFCKLYFAVFFEFFLKEKHKMIFKVKMNSCCCINKMINRKEGRKEEEDI